MSGPGTAVRVTTSRQRADEWAVVLAAADIPHWTRHRLDGWAVIVSAGDSEAALEALDAYDRENATEPVLGGGEVAGARHAVVVGVAVALLLIGFFAVTGSRATHGPWFEHGSADAERILAGQWWRAVTALTLHADVLHVLGNAVACAVLVSAVCGSVGPGVGLGLLLLAGAGGNLLTAAAHGRAHVSVGASTAMFGAIGVLGALRIVGPGHARSRARTSWVVIAASLALLAMLGAGERADLLAHVFGLLVGGGLGLVAGSTLRPVPSATVQWTLVVAVAAAVYAAWRIAL